MPQQNSSSRLKRWALIVLISLILLLAIVAIILQLYSYPWSGFGEFPNPKGEIQPAKTLWDWLQLLIIPLALAGLAIGFNYAERTSERINADRRERSQREASLDQARETALQTYFDRMTELMLDRNLHEIEPDNDVHSIAYGRTRAVLSQLDGRRKGTLIEFLYAANVLGSVLPHEPETTKQDPVIYLGEAADLNHIILSRTTLWGINLEMTDMREAMLEGVDLFGAIVRGVNLSRASLYGVNFCQANLSMANLSGAKIRSCVLVAADLQGANLRGTEFSDDVDFHDVNLTDAKYDQKTKWPSGFDPSERRAVLQVQE